MSPKIAYEPHNLMDNQNFISDYNYARKLYILREMEDV